MRDCVAIALPGLTKSPEERYRVPLGFDDSKNELRQLLVLPGGGLAIGQEFHGRHSGVPSHPVRWQAWRRGNRNLTCKHRSDVGGGIYNLQSSGFAGDSTECVRILSPFCADSEHGSLGELFQSLQVRAETTNKSPSPQSSPRDRGEGKPTPTSSGRLEPRSCKSPRKYFESRQASRATRRRLFAFSKRSGFTSPFSKGRGLR